MNDKPTMEVVARGQSDEDFAKETIDKVRKALDPVCHLMDVAKTRGMTVQYQVVVDGFGRAVVQGLSVVKVMA
jgi:hypothetical protein